MAIELGASLPCGDIGTDAATVRDYAQTMEGLGIDYLQAPDHVLGGNPATVPPGKRVGTTETAYDTIARTHDIGAIGPADPTW